MTKEKTIYIVIRVKAEYDTDAGVEEGDVADMVGGNCDYSVTLDCDGVNIVETELIASETDCPI